MFKERFLKITRSVIKLILPALYRILVFFKLNRRTINYLSDKSFFSNNIHDFSSIIKDLLKDSKLIALDVGAQGGFNSDNFFPQEYNLFFEDILVEPIKSESVKFSKNKYVINKGLWSKKEKKKLYVLENRLGSSSMFEPDENNFDVHNIKDRDFNNYKVTRTLEVDCDTIHNELTNFKIKNLDYLKIDTQGAELEILKGLGNYQPLFIKVETHIFSMYKNVSGWNKVLDYLYDLNYIAIDWKPIGSHATRIPAEMDMMFIPNFNNNSGANIIKSNKEKFICLMLIFGQLNLLKIIIKRLNLDYKKLEKFEDQYFN